MLRRFGALVRRVVGVYAAIGRVYRHWWAQVLVLGLVVFVPLGLLDALAAEFDVNTIEVDSGVKVVALIAALGALTTTGLLGEVFFAGAISLSLTHPSNDEPPPLRELARRIRYGRLILLDIVFVLIVALGLVLFLVPGVLAFVYLALAGPAVEIEHRTVRGALARSFRLVRADFWLVFWVLVPIEIAGDALGEAVEHLGHELFGEGFVTVWLTEAAANIVLSPVFAIAAVLLATRLIAVVDGSGPQIRSLRDRHREELGATG